MLGLTSGRRVGKRPSLVTCSETMRFARLRVQSETREILQPAPKGNFKKSRRKWKVIAERRRWIMTQRMSRVRPTENRSIGAQRPLAKSLSRQTFASHGAAGERRPPLSPLVWIDRRVRGDPKYLEASPANVVHEGNLGHRHCLRKPCRTIGDASSTSRNLGAAPWATQRVLRSQWRPTAVGATPLEAIRVALVSCWSCEKGRDLRRCLARRLDAGVPGPGRCCTRSRCFSRGGCTQGSHGLRLRAPPGYDRLPSGGP
jgi:hypothetical protein